MKKSLRNLAKVAAGLGAAYAISKMGKADTTEAEGLRMQAQAEQEDASRAAFARKNVRISDARRMANQAAQEDASRAAFAQANRTRGTFGSETPQDMMSKSRRGIYGEPGSIEGFREANRQAALRRGQPFTESEGSPIALRRKRLGFEKGGSVVARGNKLARSKPTKLF